MSDDKGEVPAWVLVVVMVAGLVLGLAATSPDLVDAFPRLFANG